MAGLGLGALVQSHFSTNRPVETISMFNQLSPAEVTTAIGATLRAAARSDGQASEFERDQLMSAYSATRHLAVELATFEPELRSFTTQVTRQLRADEIPGLERDLGRLSERLEGAGSVSDVGEAICVLFESLDRAPSPAANALRSRVHVLLRALADREVDLLADALG
jgi:hypothetical protein